MKYSEEIIADAVRKYWNETYPHDVVVFFEQKYEHEFSWNEEWVIAEPYESSNNDAVIFNTDFCEGQTEVRGIKIADLDDVIDFYRAYGNPKVYEENDDE